MSEQTKTGEDVCNEIAGELEEIARGLSGGMQPEQFRELVEILEEQKVKRHGFTLHSNVSDDRIVHFSLRFWDTGELCASMDVDPITGKLSVQHACS